MITIEKSAQRAPKRHPFSTVVRLVVSSGLTASLAIGVAGAQERAPSEGLEEVTVTGTRIVRDGYEAPTPVSMLNTEALQMMGDGNIAYSVYRMPVFTNSTTSHNSPSVISNGRGGVNALNLRGLGETRTLVLFDGKRIVGSSLDGGAVDINALPNGLIERVEVVTGGASAVYGSDALAGVANFILDTDYTGFKGTVQGGATTHGDNERYKASFTAGTPFAGARGHFLFSGEYGYEAAVVGKPREWADIAYQLINNPSYTPTNGQPQLITVFERGVNNAAPGGLIVSCPLAPGGESTTDCPLRGTQFLAGGAPTAFDFGPIMSGVVMSGGDWQTSRIDRVGSLALELQRTNAFSRVSYDVGDSTAIYVELLWSRTSAYNGSNVPNFNLGNVQVLSGNPFIPAPVQAQMTDHGISSFTLGTTNGDMPYVQVDNTRTLERYVAGAEGEFDVAGTDWLWDASYLRNTTDIIAQGRFVRINANYAHAVDAVLHDGQIVCRVNVDADPENDDPACIPYNPMGLGVNSQSALDYVLGTPYSETLLEQDVVALSATGEPFSSWAGPVSLAFGAAHRREEVSGYASPIDEADGFFAGNYNASFGSYDVTEGFVETVVPVAIDQFYAESLDLNGAVRWTDYSTSGEVVTWKLGASWAPAGDLRFRFTRSRDIRAPNLGDLFAAGTAGRGTVFDPFTNTSPSIILQTRGNPNLDPEEADTTGLGVIYRPSWLPAFAVSVDYYEIDIQDAIATLGTQEYVNRCFEGVTELCPFVHRDANGTIFFVDVQPANILAQRTSGFDIEASYSFPLSNIHSDLNGDLSLRAFVTYVDSLETADEQMVIEGAGVNSDSMGTGEGNALFGPDLRYLVWASYNNDPVTLTLTMRGIGSGVYNNAFIECVPGSCPAATPEHPTINTNHIDAATYFDLSLAYKVFEDRGELFFVAQNILDEDPPLIAGPTNTGFHSGQGNEQFYDRLGGMFRAGMRFEF